ncbi:MAG: hypothetical protein SFW07_04255 [Gammaproteobacteria bacterium]|nr:hypothetical protein [Gammaproteobacteria bacterium]
MKEDDDSTPPTSPKFETPGKIGTAWGRIISADKVSAFIVGPQGTPAKTPTSVLNKQAQKYVKGHSPYKEPATPGSTEKSVPKSIRTESGEKLEFVGIFDDLAVYARIPNFRREPSHTTMEKLISHESTEATPTKTQVYDSETAQRAVGKKNRSQKAVMGNVSAQTVVTKLFDQATLTDALNKMELSQEARAGIVKQFEDFSAEWLHLIDYAKVGHAGQIRANLVAGSHEANSMMMIIESYTNDQLKKGNGVFIEVEARIAKNDFTKKIIMRVTTEDPKMTTEIIINPFTKIKPVVQAKPYFDIRQQIKAKELKSK